MNVSGYRFRRGWLAVLLLSAGLATTHAQTMDFGRCVPIEDLSARLACYDRAAGRPSATAAAAAPAAPAAQRPPQVPNAAPAPAPAPAAAADPVANFGANGNRSDPLTAARVQREAEPDAPRQIEAKVTAVRSRLTGEQVLTLDNGQVWEQTESRREPQYKVGDTIIIRRGMLGSFMLTQAKGSATTRVRRIS
jgi:hypothetical protein